MTRRWFFQAFAAAIVAICLLALPGALWAQGNRDSAFERVVEVQERHTGQLMAMQGVVGTAVGLNEHGRHAILVLLEEPGVGVIPRQLEGVPVRPVVTGRIEALKPSKPSKPGKPQPPAVTIDRTAWFERPVPIGVSTGHPTITAGTIGCRLVGKSGNVYALSNNHVYGAVNTAEVGDPVLQPGMYDILDHGLTWEDCIIGDFCCAVPIETYDPASPPAVLPVNYVDAAIALTGTGLVGNATPADGYGAPKSRPTAALFNMPVKKYGRTTGLTTGKVYAVSGNVEVWYSDTDAAFFVDQIIITPGGFSAGGDSGSLIVGASKGRNKTNDRVPVGLLFAGNSQCTIASPIASVLDALSVEANDDLSIDGR